MNPRIAIIGAGGTFAMQGRHDFDWVEYGDSGIVHDIATVLRDMGDLGLPLDLQQIPFRAIGSTGIVPADWVDLAALVHALQSQQPDLAGIVITHGTATLEETAWFLHLTKPQNIALAITGAQRPPNTSGSDAAANLRAALAAVANSRAASLGALVVMDNTMLSARDATKTSSFALDAFESPGLGPLGAVLADGTLRLLRAPTTPSGIFPAPQSAALPRVDIVTSYAGADGTAVQAFRAAGARAIISAGLLPGRPANAEHAALREAAASGILVVQSTSGPRGMVPVQRHNVADNILAGGDLSPRKLRILLMLALQAGLAAPDIQSVILNQSGLP